MKIQRAQLIAGILLSFVIVALVYAPAFAQQWPAKPLRIIVPFPPGQGADIVGRLVAERLTVVLGQQVIVENRPGAGSMLGTEYAAKAPGDGYTLLIGGTSALVINPHLYSKLGYDTARDFAPITNLASLPMVICVNPSFPAHNIQDLIKLAKRRPGEVTYGSSGNGSTDHLTQALFASAAGIRLTHVPYKGSAASMTDLIGGQIAMATATTPGAVPYVRAGQIRALGVTSIQRSSFLPQVPTLDEQGVRGFNVIAWAGLVAPAKTPLPILDRLNSEVVRMLKTPEMHKRFQDLSMAPIGDTREQFGAFLKAELATWGEAVKFSGVKIE
jgi:tripartite-type tricarboxylate transporter receptor subunit TctC